MIGNKIVISGISGRFPKSSNIGEFRKGLLNGVDLVTDNHNRWPHEAMNLPSRMGLVEDLHKFDATFFGMNPKQTQMNDPRIRKLLEVVFEAIVDAGVNPTELRGSDTAVFLAVTQSLFDNTPGSGLLSRSTAIMANTISYSFDFKGPSYALDTGCSSSLYALHQASEALRNGMCTSAVVCTGQVNLAPNESIEFASLGVINREGKSKTFDQHRNGYVKSDAIVAIYLQKIADSKRIYATIAGTGTNVDGFKSDGLNHPSHEMQRALLETVYSTFNINPDDVEYVETHGTGTVVGDIEETQALTEFFCKTRKKPLMIGSVKSNAGHAETSSGLVSIVKAIISINGGVIPGNLHYKTPAKDIPGIQDGRLKVVSENTIYEGGLIAINSFGFGGANGHVVLQPFSKTRNLQNQLDHHLIPVSGRTDEAVKTLLREIMNNKKNPEFLTLIDSIFSTPIENHNYRGYALLLSENVTSEIGKCTSKKRPVWFVYSGMGSQWPGMGKQLIKNDVFRQAIQKCAQAVKPYGVDLEHIIIHGDKKDYDNIINCFTAIAAVTVGLTDILYSLGIKPDGIIGHSLGEVGCAYADGMITAEQATLIAYGRGFATLNTELIRGLMASVGLSAEECQKWLTDDIYVACNNSPHNVTISGPEQAVRMLIQRLSREGIFTKLVNTANIAFHSKHIHPAGAKLLEFLKTVVPENKARSAKWLPSAIPQNDWETDLGKYNSAEYHYTNYMNVVQFNQVLQSIPKNAILVEVAPRGLLQAIFRTTLGNDVTKLSLSSHEAPDNLQFLWQNIGRFYIAGGQPKLNNVNKELFPVSKGTPTISNLIKWDHNIDWLVSLYNPDKSFGEEIIIDVNDPENKFLQGHVVDGRVLYPATGYVVLAWRTFAKMLGRPQNKCPVVVENVKIIRATLLNDIVKLVVYICKPTGHFEICEDATLVASGKITLAEELDREYLNYSNLEEPSNHKLKLNNDDFYKELHLRGYDYYGIFRGVVEADIDGRHGVLKWFNNWISFMDTILHHIVMKEQKGLFVPTKVDKIIIDPLKHLNLQEGDEISLDYNKNTNSAKCGGIEMCKLHGVNIKRRKELLEPIIQKYEFVPNITHAETSNLRPIEYSLTVALQIVIDNIIDVNTIKIAELEAESNFSIIEVAKNVILKNHSKKVQFETINEIEENYQLLIVPDLSKQIDQNMLKYAKNCKFVFSKCLHYDEDYLKSFDLECVYKHITPSETFVLLKKSEKLPDKFSIIHANNSKFNWFEDLKSAIKSDNSKIYLVSQESNSGILGLFTCIRAEKSCPNLRIFFVKDGEPFSIRSKFYSNQLQKDLTVNIYQDKLWGTYILLPHENLNEALFDEACLLSLNSGNTGVRWMQQTPHYKPFARKISVFCSALNIWDNLIINGKVGRNVEDASLGMEYSGTDDAGNKVIGIVPTGSLSTFVNAHPKLTWKMPSKWTFEQGATVPLAYTLCQYGLNVKSQLASNDSIFISDATKDLGQAAIALALHKGCTVFAHVQNQNDKNYIGKQFPKIPINNILISDISQLLAKGGVDVLFICNNEYNKHYYRLAKRNSRIIHFDFNNDFNDSIENLINKNCLFHTISISDVLNEDDNCLSKIFSDIEEYLKNDVIKPMKYVVFEKNEITSAINSVGKSTDKCLVKIKNKGSFFYTPDNRCLATPRTYMDPQKSYIIIGGLGGFGLELANWLIQRGATKLILNSRSGVNTGYQAYCLSKWKDLGVVVLTDTSDTTTFGGAQSLINFALNLGPIGGIFNLAMVLKDELITNQTINNFEAVVGPKLFVTQNMDYLSRKLCPTLEHFVIFSSMVASLGNATQSNYGFANSLIERLCESRKAERLPALAVQWGPIADVGFVARLKTNVKVLEAIPQSIKSCLNILDQFLQQSHPVVASSVFGDEDENLGPNESLLEAVASVFGLKNIELVDDSTTLLNLGMDSLVGFELKNLLSKDYNIEFTIEEIRNLTIESLKELSNSL